MQRKMVYCGSRAVEVIERIGVALELNLDRAQLQQALRQRLYDQGYSLGQYVEVEALGHTGRHAEFEIAYPSDGRDGKALTPPFVALQIQQIEAEVEEALKIHNRLKMLHQPEDDLEY